MAQRVPFGPATGNVPVATKAASVTKPVSTDPGKRARDEQMEALVRSRDAALSKAAAAQAEAQRWKGEAEAAAKLQQMVATMRQTIGALETQLAESRAFEVQMAVITSALERERDVLQRELLRCCDAAADEGEVERLRSEVRRRVDDERVRARMAQDKLDAEQLRNEALQKEYEQLRQTMGNGIDELRSQMENGLSLALARTDHLETLLGNERAKTKRYLRLLTNIVDKDDLAVLLEEDADEVK